MGRPGCANPSTKDVITGFRKVPVRLESAYPDRTSLVAVGAAPDPSGRMTWPTDPEFVVGGAVRLHGRWWARSLQEYMIAGYGPEGCDTQLASRLVPGTKVIVAQCLTGGTDGVDFVVVAGRPKGYAFPVVLLAVSCGVTQAEVDGTKMVVYTEGPKPGSAYPGAKQPTFVFSWQSGSLQTSASSFYKYCATPDDYFVGH